MILFLYGKDTYRSRRKLDEIRAKFMRDIDPSGLNLTVLDGTKAEIGEIRAAAASAPFLAKKRLTILKNALRDAKKADDEALATILASVPEDTILTVYEDVGSEDLDGLKSFEFLKNGKFYPEFMPFDQRQLPGWILQEAKARGTEFAKDALATYATASGNELWKIAAELDQMTALAATTSGIIDLEIVRTLAHVLVEENIFDFLDAVGARRTDRAAELLERLLDQGETEAGLLNRLQAHIRALLVSADLARLGRVSKENLARTLGLHPFVAGKILSQVRHHTFEELAGHYDWLIESDRRLKTGGWPKPRMAIDLFLLRLVESRTSAQASY